MTTVTIDLRQLSGGTSTTEPLEDAGVDFTPFRPYADAAALITGNFLPVDAPAGVATVTLPPTPAGEAVWVQERGFAGAARFLTAIPAGESVAYTDLPHLDPSTLDPETPLDPAWLDGLEDAQAAATTAQELAEGAETKADAALSAAGAASSAAVAAQGVAEDAAQGVADLSTAVGQKVDTETVDAALGAVQGLIETAQSAADDALAGVGSEVDARVAGDQAVAQALSTYATANDAAVGGKASQTALTNGLANKADQSALTSGLASKVEVSSAGREALAIPDYAKMRPLFADLANWRNKRVDILMVGDSAPEGYGLTSWDAILPAQLAAQIRSRYGMPAGGRGFIGCQGDKTNHPFWPDVYSGTSAAVSPAGYGAHMRQLVLSGTGKEVHTVQPGGITGFLIHYALFGTGTFSYKIDGNAAVNVVANGSAAVVPTTLLVNTAVTSTIEIAAVSGTSYVAGLQELKGDKDSGLQVHNLGFSGSYASFWNGLALSTAWPAAQALFAASAAIVNIGGNDGRSAGQNKTAATFQTDLATLVAKLATTVVPTGPIIVNMQWSMGDANLREPWANYVAAAKAVCDASSRAVLVDQSVRMPASNVADTLGLFNAAALPHGSAKGYALTAATLAKALDPR